MKDRCACVLAGQHLLYMLRADEVDVACCGVHAQWHARLQQYLAIARVVACSRSRSHIAPQGVYYGAFSGQSSASQRGDLASLWVVSRPHNWHATTTIESLLHLELPSGHELDRKQIQSR
jgi:hypothetical protein